MKKLFNIKYNGLIEFIIHFTLRNNVFMMIKISNYLTKNKFILKLYETNV